MPLTNSISLAERHRIRHSIKQARGKQYRDFCPFRHGERKQYRDFCPFRHGEWMTLSATYCFE